MKKLHWQTCGKQREIRSRRTSCLARVSACIILCLWFHSQTQKGQTFVGCKQSTRYAPLSHKDHLPILKGSAKVVLRASELDAGATALFFLWGTPAPIAFSTLLRRAEDLSAQVSSSYYTDQGRNKNNVGIQPATEPRDMMWAFPSFGVFLQEAETAPQGMSSWTRWLFVFNVWAAIVWYLYYKILVEEELREQYGLGIGGYLVVVPFALGLSGGIYGQFAYGSLVGDPFCDIWSSVFYFGFLWIYINQYFLYQKVNKLYTDQDRPAPLDEFGLLIPGWNFVTGIRQIHFLAEHWARERGTSHFDAFCELFPFTSKPTLTFFELLTTPSLWINTQLLTDGSQTSSDTDLA